MRNSTIVIHSLGTFGSFLRILKAYNLGNFQQIDRRQNVQNVCFAIGVFAGTALIASIITLGVWRLIDFHGNLNKCAVCGPIVLTTLQMLITCIALTTKNHEIEETFALLQSLLDQRKFFFVHYMKGIS